jgi:hypothetical protein
MADGPHLLSINQLCDIKYACKLPLFDSGRGRSVRWSGHFLNSKKASGEFMQGSQFQVSKWTFSVRFIWVSAVFLFCAARSLSVPISRTSTRDEYGSVADDPHLQGMGTPSQAFLRRIRLVDSGRSHWSPCGRIYFYVMQGSKSESYGLCATPA